MNTAASVLYVTIDVQINQKPKAGVLDGLTRTFRTEYQSVPLTTIRLQSVQDIGRTVDRISRV